jgi:H+/Cl- antiporter ClcA
VIFRIGKGVAPRAAARPFLVLPVVGLAVAGLAMAFTETTDKGLDQVLFSGQEAIGPLIDKADTWSVSALALLLLFKGLAYGISLGSFRGGPVFPAMFLGSAAGLMASHLPGFDLTPAVAVGMGAAVVAILRLPLAAVILATLLTSAGGVGAGPVVIIGVVVAYIVTLALPGSGPETTPSHGEVTEESGAGPSAGTPAPA